LTVVVPGVGLRERPMTAEGVVKNCCDPLDMAEKITKRLRDVVDLLESAVEEKDWRLVEEALDELRGIVDELEE
jgi:hypothetical protein